ncbi:hypothetical protein BG004_003074, partial [Podila humilis]
MSRASPPREQTIHIEEDSIRDVFQVPSDVGPAESSRTPQSQSTTTSLVKRSGTSR